MTEQTIKIGQRYRWEPGLKMDQDTGREVEIIDSIASGSGSKWRVRVTESEREFSVYVDELREVSS